MLVRCAEDSDAGPAAEVVRRSVAELCEAEYRGDPQVLARWLANKTLGDFRRWIGSADRSVCLAVRADGRLAAVGMVAWRGEILLNYVAPEARFLGASKALVAHMEGHLRARGGGQGGAAQHARRAPVLPVARLRGGRPRREPVRHPGRDRDGEAARVRAAGRDVRGSASPAGRPKPDVRTPPIADLSMGTKR